MAAQLGVPAETLQLLDNKVLSGDRGEKRAVLQLRLLQPAAGLSEEGEAGSGAGLRVFHDCRAAVGEGGRRGRADGTS